MDKHPSNPAYSNERINESADTNDAANGTVKWAPIKSLWFSGMAVGAIWGGSTHFTWGALLLFLPQPESHFVLAIQ